MFTLEDVPLEIRHKIIEQALPDFATQPRCSLYSAHLEFRKAFCRTILAIATISRLSIETVHYSIEKVEKEELRLMYTYAQSDECVGTECRTCSMDRWYTLKMTRKSLQSVLESSTQGVTVS